MSTDGDTDGALARRLLASGREGTATVTAVRDTGELVGENPEVELDLDVFVDDEPVYPVTHRLVVSRLARPGFQPGATFPVRVDPDEPGTLVIA